MVPVAGPPVAAMPRVLITLTKNVSSGSITRSPRTLTEKLPVNAPPGEKFIF